MSGDLRAADDAIRLARATLRTIKGNLFSAFADNIAAVPLAAVGLLDLSAHLGDPAWRFLREQVGRTWTFRLTTADR